MANRLIEEELPPEYLYELGIYLQTCAGIEYWIASAICSIEGLCASDEQWQERHNEVRKQTTKELISALGRAGRSLDEGEWRRYLEELSAWMHRFVNNRHIAIHGVHRLVNGQIEIDAAPTKSRLDQITTATKSDISEVIDDADQILRGLQSFVKSVENS